MPATKPKLILLVLFLTACALANDASAQALHGTLVVAVPARDGLVVCSDKRLSNLDAGTAEDTFVKIRKVDRRTLFVATNTIAFRDRSSGDLAFDVFDITSRYLQQRPFAAGRSFWAGLKRHLLEHLQDYLAKRRYEEWPATDVVNNRLLFNLLFFSTDGKTARSHTLRLFYEKKRTPAIFIPDVISEEIRSPKLSGKGNLLLEYLARDISAARDPLLQRFDPAKFDKAGTSVSDAVSFSAKLFAIANTALPQAGVSGTYDCALLRNTTGFEWVRPTGYLSVGEGRSDTP